MVNPLLFIEMSKLRSANLSILRSYSEFSVLVSSLTVYCKQHE